MPDLKSPSEFPNPRGDDSWDNDAIYWMLTQSGGQRWTRFVLGECLCFQPNPMSNDGRRVREAALLAARHGVRQVELPRGNRTIVRLIRTDPGVTRLPWPIVTTDTTSPGRFVSRGDISRT